jgi:hypothetical protein
MPFRWTSQVIVAKVDLRTDSGGIGFDFKALFTLKLELLRSRHKTQTAAPRSGRDPLSGNAEHDTLHWFLALWYRKHRDLDQLTKPSDLQLR